MWGRARSVSTSGFVFDAALLQRVPSPQPIWNYTGHGGESELIVKLLGPAASAEDLQPLANCGQDVLVFHNEYRTVPVPVHRPRQRCATDGWGFEDDGERRIRPTRPWPSVYELPVGRRRAVDDGQVGKPRGVEARQRVAAAGAEAAAGEAAVGAEAVDEVAAAESVVAIMRCELPY